MKNYKYFKLAYKLTIQPFISGAKNIFSQPNKQACLIFGLQKSGTTAIAALLAKKADLSVTLDTKYLWMPYLSKLISGEMSLAKHIYNKSYPFSKDIIKEPNLSYFIDELPNIFEMNKYILIIRNPFDNIRSILNSLYLPGDASNLNMKIVPYYWQHLLSGDKNDNYIAALAKRWVKTYEKIDLIEKNNCILVRYEEFSKNKDSFISELIVKLGMKEKNSISHLLDKQFQRKGNRDVNLLDFFGRKNYETINHICGDLIKHYGYESSF